ncbi:MAG: hypothetical protein II820_06335 [Ruminiclostridium sp.]|nr:hypothetical protein [Ruminiclostridium sp.]
MAEKRKGFLMYADYGEYFDMLGNEELGMLIREFFHFTAGGTADTSGFSPQTMFLYTMLRKNYERDTEAYKKVCEKRSMAAKQRCKNPEPENSPSFNIAEIESRTYEKYMDL